MSKSQAWKWVGCGCGAIALMVAILGVATALNWSRVTRVYEQAKTSVGNLMRVVTTLQARYGGHVNIMVVSRSGVDGAILQITLTNPTFLDQGDPGEERVKAKALEAAAAARDALDPQSRYEHYEIVVVRQSGAGITVSQSWSFQFRAADLPAAR